VRSRYVRWDGSQDPLREVPDIGELLDRLGDDLLMGRGREALEGLRRRGLPGRRGWTSSAARWRPARALRDELDADGPLAELARELDEIVDIEREALAQRDDEDARFDELRWTPCHPIRRAGSVRCRATTSARPRPRSGSPTSRTGSARTCSTPT
jgi:uncharacterized protein with von Willebrand factor type A (vWA) domain